MKYGATNFVKNDGRTSASRTTALGTLGPTRSRAAESIITYKTLFIRPETSQRVITQQVKKNPPNNQNAISTEVSAPWKMVLNRALYRAQVDPGEPGSGRRPDVDEDLFIVCSCRYRSNSPGTMRV